MSFVNVCSCCWTPRPNRVTHNYLFQVKPSVDLSPFVRLHNSLLALGKAAQEVDPSDLTKNAMVALARKVDPGFVCRTRLEEPTDGKEHFRAITPGGFFGTAMVFMEYGEKARLTLEHILFKSGHNVRCADRTPKRQKKSAQIRLRYIALMDRIRADLPTWLLRQLSTLGGKRYELFQTMFLDALDYLGLHQRGMDLVRAYMTTSTGARKHTLL